MQIARLNFRIKSETRRISAERQASLNDELHECKSGGDAAGVARAVRCLARRRRGPERRRYDLAPARRKSLEEWKAVIE